MLERPTGISIHGLPACLGALTDTIVVGRSGEGIVARMPVRRRLFDAEYVVDPALDLHVQLSESVLLSTDSLGVATKFRLRSTQSERDDIREFALIVQRHHVL